MGEWVSWLLQKSWLVMGADDLREHMLRFCCTIGTLTSCVWVRSAVRWAAGCPSGHFRCTLVKVSWSTLGSQQVLLTHAQVCGPFALLFGLWPAGRWMGERLGPCRILGNLCGLWIYVRIRCSFAVRLGLLQSCVRTRSTVRWMAGWPPAKRRLDQIDLAMDGWVAVCQATPGLD